MSVQVRRRREAAAFLSTFVGAQAELIVDTTNNRVQVHDGATPGGWPAAKLADVAQRTAVADSAYTAKTTDRTIVITALTAARTITLPAASTFPTGTTLTIADESGACATLTVSVAAAGTDTINGVGVAPIATAYGYVALQSNGVGRWTIVDAPGTGRTAVADANYTALATDRTIAFTALTAARTVTLPAASAYPTGTQLLVVDESGACSTTSTITIARAGADTINGATSALLSLAFGYVALESNGTAKWTQVDYGGVGMAQTAQLTNRNAVINGNFVINQRPYSSGTALAAGAYGHDRWKAGSGGCTYTIAASGADAVATITAGTLIQAVDSPNVYASAYWLSWTGTATARVWQGSASGSFAAGTSANIGGTVVNTLLVSGLTIGTIANLEFSTGTLGLVQFEAALPNAGPTRFERRHQAQELLLCQRTFQNGHFRVYAPSTYIGGSFNVFCPMRATPSVAITSDDGKAGQVSTSASSGAGVAITAGGAAALSNYSVIIDAYVGSSAGNWASLYFTLTAEI